MALSLHESFDRCCRLCAEEQEVTIMIFSAEAEAMLLQNKLNKYLLIEIVCEFIDTARKAQEVLLNQSIILDQFTPQKCVVLSKTDIKPEPADSDDENLVTEMEISVDPMMVLQNSDSMQSPNIEDNNEQVEDITHLHSVDGENVTIKLIKRGDAPADKSEESKGKGKPFPCITCKRSFFTELALKNHSWIHFNEDRVNKMFKCGTCAESFDYKCDLILHLKKHKTNGLCTLCGRCNERPYNCHLCKKSFKRNQDLKFHINQHTGDKPYQCPFCDKSFASSGNCYSHRSRMHPGRRVDGKIRRRIPVSTGALQTRPVSNNLILNPRPIAPKPSPATTPRVQQLTSSHDGYLTFLTCLYDLFKLLHLQVLTTMSTNELSNHRRMARQNGIVQPLLTDLYQITMAYAYWKSDKVNDVAVFDLFFRTNPFQGEFTIFAGLEECLKFLENFHYSDSDIEYLIQTLPDNIEPDFFAYLRELTCKDITLSAIEEGSVVFPRVPLLRVEGPLIIAQLLETTLLTLVNFASLMATNAARYRMVAGKNVSLLEFGLRRAQGPDGGFDGTSNVLAGKMFNIPVRGTHAHSFVTSFSTLADLSSVVLRHAETQKQCNLLELATEWRKRVSAIMDVSTEEASDGELAALISYALAFPSGFLALVDTYDVKRSGLLNFCAVALALHDCGYRAIGIRIDSGDLAYLSVLSRDTFAKVADTLKLPWFRKLTIVASNDINEETILSLNEQGHKIDCFGIGTHLVTCQRQPALGCVYKLVEINGQPRIKLSQDVGKVTIPGHKEAYRLFGADGHALIDLLQRSLEPPPKVGQKVLCRHPFQESKRAYVIPSKVEHLYKVCWKDGRICTLPKPLSEVRERVQSSLKTLRQDIKRNLNPTPYKVAVSDDLYIFIHDLWLQNAPIGELS
ncbi:hypothetical protein MSG28_011067 [Choristoneura fumiferana]|uniref:Uncharacterized protein n=1 Tax=Choristoneura fumiferana TaxID=7141 RepID=A0ACC0KQN6_CHOFU|nr:hypothetical protein MSG28_011067 [Choristoneura fumiferana]